jgi:hypothetical protein
VFRASFIDASSTMAFFRSLAIMPNIPQNSKRNSARSDNQGDLAVKEGQQPARLDNL